MPRCCSTRCCTCADVKQVDADGKPTDELAVPLDDIRRFRQLDSRCPGHPEHGHTSGVETTTGPLGQGIGNSVGMAIASRWLAGRYNRPGFELFDYNVYALCSDGDMMEGVGARGGVDRRAPEALEPLLDLRRQHDHDRGPHASWPSAKTWRALRRLRLERGQGRRRQRSGRACAALQTFQETTDRPTLIIVRSVIAYGSPNKHNTHGAHGAPLGEEEVRLTKEAYGWPEDAEVPRARRSAGALPREHRQSRAAVARANGKPFAASTRSSSRSRRRSSI